MNVGNFSWGSEYCTCKTRIINFVCDAANNELVFTKSLEKNCIMLIDSTPYRQWVVWVPLCTDPGPQDQGQANSWERGDFKQKAIKKFRRNMMKGKRIPKSAAVLAWKLLVASLQDQDNGAENRGVCWRARSWHPSWWSQGPERLPPILAQVIKVFILEKK